MARRTGIALATALACLATPAAARAADPVIAAAGDIACASFTATSTSCQQKATSDLLVGAGYAKVLSLGDQQYENGSLSLFNTYYDASWGRVKSITAPVPGNHEYQTSGASGYYDYFGALAGPRGKGYYSFNLGSWHLVGLNSNCAKVSCSAGSVQEQWLRADLAANPRQCVLGFFHHANLTAPTTALRQAFFQAGGDVILTGHNHVYRRLGPRDASLNADPAGYREFIVGTGGVNVSGSPFGILQLTLRPARYDWKFISIARVTGDTGSASCNPAASPPPPAPDTTPPSPATGLRASAVNAGEVSLSWAAASDNIGVNRYQVFRGATRIATVGAVTTYADATVAASTSYSYTVRAVDAAGNVSSPSNAANVTTPGALPKDIRAPAQVRVRGSAFERRFQRKRAFLVAWSATDDRSGIASYDVRYRRTDWRATSRPIRSWLRATTETSARFRGVAGSTYCFSTRARDRARNVSRWSAERCTALPLDDRSLTARGPWRRSDGSGLYLNTVSTSRTNRAALVRIGVRATRLSLLVTRCRACGTVRVYWNGSLLRTIQLGANEKRRRQLVGLAVFDHVTRGNVLIRVTSAGKPVAIDGLGVSSS